MTKEAAEEILELPRRYSKEDLRRAYTQMARRYHPDAAAQHHYDPAAAQARMVEANQANQVLKREFAQDPDRMVTRSGMSIAEGYGSVDWRSGLEQDAVGDDPWDFVDDWDGAEAPKKTPLTVRSVLLGPVVLRIAFIALAGLLWWNVFPLLPNNLPRFMPAGGWSLLDVSRLVTAMVYPTYLVVYEAVSGYVSGVVRELLNGLVSLLTGRYVDLRPKTSTYGCSLSKLIHEQVYALLLAPVALYLAAVSLAQTSAVAQIAWGAAAILIAIDALAACAHGGLVNVWSVALAERVENAYLLLRARVLKRCNAWEG